MTYGPPPEPEAPPPGPNFGYAGPPPHPHAIPNGGPPPVNRSQGAGPAVAAVILGLLGCVLPLLPIDLTGVRAYVALPLALPGLVLAVVGCAGHRRGKPLAVAGAVLSALALLLGVAMLAGSILG
jgi:hypothetical protein